MRRISKKFGVGVVGTGFMGAAHVEALRRLGINIVGICGSNPEKSEKAGSELGVDGFASYEELLDHPNVGAIHITSPNHLHFPMLKKAIQAQKHVLCEKPLVLNSQEAAEAVALAKSSASVVCVNYNLRYYPLCLEAKARVQRGDLGKIIHISGGYLQDWLVLDSDFNWRVTVEKGGPLRAIADIGTHWMDLIQFLTGSKIESLCANLSTFHETRLKPEAHTPTFSNSETKQGEPISIQTEDFGMLWMKLEDGTLASAVISQVAAGRKNRLHFEINGSQASLAWDGEKPNELWMGHREKPNQTIIKDPSLVSSAVSQYCGYPAGHAEGYPDTFKQCFKEFYEYLASDRSEPPAFPTIQEGQWEIDLCESILKSHQNKSWVKVYQQEGRN